MLADPHRGICAIVVAGGDFMPTSYAHHKFGQQVLEQLPKELQKPIKKESELYELGLNGPDLFFFYRPYVYKNEVNMLGYGMHEEPALPFFRHAAKIALKDGFPATELSYLYGFIAHFALDRICHEYIYAEEGEVTHQEMESELDRVLMEQDGLDPVTHHQTDEFHASMKNAGVIAKFFPVSADEVYISIHQCKRYKNLLVPSGRQDQERRFELVNKTPLAKKLDGVMMNLKPDDKCAESNEVLENRMELGVPEAVSLIEDFIPCARGEKMFSSLYDYDFCGKLHIRKKVHA